MCHCFLIVKLMSMQHQSLIIILNYRLHIGKVTPSCPHYIVTCKAWEAASYLPLDNKFNAVITINMFYYLIIISCSVSSII